MREKETGKAHSLTCASCATRKSDPLETRNLARSAQHAAVRTKLAAQLTSLLAAEGLTPDKDKMPLDEGIKTELPDQKIR